MLASFPSDLHYNNLLIVDVNTCHQAGNEISYLMGNPLINIQWNDSCTNEIKPHFGFEGHVLSEDIPSRKVPRLLAPTDHTSHPLKLVAFAGNLLSIHTIGSDWIIPKQRVDCCRCNIQLYTMHFNRRQKAWKPVYTTSMPLGILCRLVRDV